MLAEAALLPGDNGMELVPVFEIYRITEWDRAEILSTRLPDEPAIGQACERATLRLNRVERSATRTRSALSRRGVCKLPGFKAEEGVSRLATPAQADSTNSREAQALFDSILQMGPEMRAAVADLKTMGVKSARQKKE